MLRDTSTRTHQTSNLSVTRQLLYLTPIRFDIILKEKALIFLLITFNQAVETNLIMRMSKPHLRTTSEKPINGLLTPNTPLVRQKVLFSPNT